MWAQVCLTLLICAGAFAGLAQNDEWTNMSKEMPKETHQVRISTDDQGDICMGALVEPKKVLTTRKCIESSGTDDLRVRLGGSRQGDLCRVISIKAFQQDQQRQQQQPQRQGKDDTLVILTLDKEISNQQKSTIEIQDDDITRNENVEVQALGLNDNIDNKNVGDDEKNEQENLSVRKANFSVTQIQGRKCQLSKNLQDTVENGALIICTNSQKLCGIKLDDGSIFNLTDNKVQEFLSRNL